MRMALGAVAAGLALGLGACGGDDAAVESDAPQATEDMGSMVLASTTSTQDSGLFDDLIPAFEAESGCNVKTVAVGSGQAIELGERGEADAVFAHSPAAEEALMETGVAGSRELVMHNDFVIIGPEDDPAGIRGDSAVEALRKIAEEKARFVSRGDDSGTHAAELGTWEKAGVEPEGSWYQETGQGMGATLAVAAERGAYTLADRGTYLANEQADELPVLVDGGPGLLNFYHVIDIDPEAGARVNAECGDAFAAWVVSGEAQQIIGELGREEFGQPLFTPDAGKSVAEIDPSAA